MVLHEIHQNFRLILLESLAGMKEMEFRIALQKQFGTIEKGYGSLVSLRNALRSLTKEAK